MLLEWVYLIGGLVLLVFASDWLVDGAVALSKRLGLSPLVVGLTVVAYGTSFPEFVVSILAASNGVVDIAVGNVVGSNVANLGLAWAVALVVGTGAIGDKNVYRRDLPIVCAASALFWLVCLDGSVSRVEGAGLLAIALLYTVLAIKSSPAQRGEIGEQEPGFKIFGLLLLGFGGLMQGADWMVDGATEIALHYGVPERIIGLTVIAIGTSLPEIAASVAAARKGEGALTLGNILGSCLFNLTFVIGGASLVLPLSVNTSSLTFDLPVMMGLTICVSALLYVCRRGVKLHGALLIGIYAWFMYQLAISL